VVDKTIEKVVRLTITDNREYLGRLMCVDKTRSVFLQDALEVIDRSPEAEAEGRYLHHELFSPYLLGAAKEQQVVFKYVGNIVIPGKHVRTIKIDHRLQREYEAAEAKIRSAA
jgi:small nuclear ribonucleoprotein (snRNP)-like protein